MEKFTIEEIREIIEDFNTLEENEDKGLDINECVKQIENEELRDILSQYINTSDEEKTVRDFNDKIVSRIDLSIFTEETKDELIFIIKLFDEWNASYNIKEPMQMIDLVKEDLDAVAIVWKYTDKEVQKENKELLSKVIDLVKESPDDVERVWANTDKEVQKEKIEEVIDLVKENPGVAAIVWANTDKEVQKENKELLSKVIELVKGNQYAVGRVWTNTDKEVQKEKIKEVIDLVKENRDAVEIVWANTDKEVQKENKELLSKVIDLVKENPSNVARVWDKTDKEVQKEKIEEVIDIVKENPSNVAGVWDKTDKEVQKENKELLSKVIELVKGNQYVVGRVWTNTDKEVQKENKELLSKVIDLVKENPSNVARVWDNTDKEVQKEKIEEVIDIVKENPSNVAGVWDKTDKEVQKEKIEEVIDIVKENPDAVTRVWASTDKEVQKENKELLSKVIELVKEDLDAVARVWKYTDKEVQKEKVEEVIEEVIDLVKENRDAVAGVWYNTNKEVRVKNFFKILEILRQNGDKENYEKFVKNYLGHTVNFYEDGKIIIADDLKDIMANIKDDTSAEKLEKNLPFIVEHWKELSEYIQRKRAGSILKDGIEIRATSLNEILEAADAISRPIPNSLSAEEFERTKGAERVGTDTQFTVSPSTAVQRAHSLAEKMDEAPSIKKFPNFSVQSQDGQINLKVLHPQDKSSILLGYDTHCCFRPNGNADNSAKNEYSLLQYCTTTPYGGVLRCESVDGSRIYMGTPFLVNGNCMMFHSYETENREKANETNELLIEAAKKCIAKSNGTIDIVFMTDLHTGASGLHTDGKIKIPSYFDFYKEGEYDKYTDMYTNLSCANIVLAAKVGEQILAGEELVKWYEQKCQSSPVELERKLNLHFGERTEKFDFGRREVKEELDVPKLPLIQSFQARRRELEERREILALELQRRKLERKETLETSEKDELEIIKAKLESKDAKEVSKKSYDEIRIELQQNRKAQLDLYSGKDIDLIAKVYGVDLEVELTKRAEESVSSKKTKDKKKGGEGKAISILMARTRESQDERVKGISNLKQKIAKNEITDEELEILEQAGIDVTEYKKAFRENSEVTQTGNSEAERKGQIKQIVRKGMQDTAKKEEIVAEKLFERVNDDEIKSKSKRILRESIVGELKQKAAVIRKRKGIEELTEEEMQEIDEEVQRIDVNSLIEGIVSGKISEEQQEILDELKNGEYGFDIEIHKAKIKDKSELERRIRKDKLEKLKAGVTMGIEVQKKIDRLKGRIDEEERPDENISKFIYGNSWYVALDEEGYVIDSELNSKFDENGIELDTYRKTLDEYKKREIQPEAIEEMTQNVTVQDKEKAICELQEKDEEKTKKGDIIE